MVFNPNLKQTPACLQNILATQKERYLKLFLPGLEPVTFRVLGGCDNHYTTRTTAIAVLLRYQENLRHVE